MKVIMPDMAHNSIDNLFEYLAIYSSKNAMQTTEKIYDYISNLENMPYLGKYSSELPNKNFRELIFNKKQNSYRILYYISEIENKIYIVNVSNCKQNFNRILKLHNYFNSFLES